MPKATTKEKKTVSKQAVEKTASSKKDGVVLDVIDTSGKVVGNVSLPSEVFGANINKALLSQAVRVYLANQRLGTVATKTRGEVAGSTRKIYRQKGTGRARHGGVRAPIFVHGGIAHGPKQQDHSLIMPQKMRQAAMRSALSAKVGEKSVQVIDGLTSVSGKTKDAALLLKNLGIGDSKKNILFVFSEMPATFIRAVRNIEGVSYIPAQQLNTYEVLKYRRLIFAKDAIEYVGKTYSKGAKNG